MPATSFNRSMVLFHGFLALCRRAWRYPWFRACTYGAMGFVAGSVVTVTIVTNIYCAKLNRAQQELELLRSEHDALCRELESREREFERDRSNFRDALSRFSTEVEDYRTHSQSVEDDRLRLLRDIRGIIDSVNSYNAGDQVNASSNIPYESAD